MAISTTELLEALEYTQAKIEIGWTGYRGTMGEKFRDFGEPSGCLVTAFPWRDLKGPYHHCEPDFLIELRDELLVALGFSDMCQMFDWNDAHERTWNDVKERIALAVNTIGAITT